MQQRTSQQLKTKRFINLDEVLQIGNYSESLIKWIRNFRTNCNQLSQLKSNQDVVRADSVVRAQTDLSQEKQLQFYFDKFFITIKPVIHNFSQLTENTDEHIIGFYSHALTKQQIQELKLIFQPLKKFQILSKKQIQLNPNIQFEGQMQNFVRPGESIFIMNLVEPPQNRQISYWDRTMPIKRFTIQGPVIKGKGVGKQVLGMPTANLAIPKSQNVNLEQYPNGIYVTTVTIKNQNRVFLGAASLGTNPHYQNSTSNRILQIYIVNDFENQNLYDKVLIVEFYSLIRLEFKFKDFSAFLNGMRNDIEITKRFKQILPSTSN